VLNPRSSEGRRFSEAKVIKSHYVQTGERAQVASKAVPGSRVFGALTLNHSVGA
jgi:hypothetical protein